MHINDASDILLDLLCEVRVVLTRLKHGHDEINIYFYEHQNSYFEINKKIIILLSENTKSKNKDVTLS